jgi:hypothetical protein
MPNERESKLAGLIQRELSRLPLIEAPTSLLPRVMAAVEARAGLPWWKRSWRTWPWSCRIVFLLTSLLLAMGCAYGLGLVGEAGSSQSLRGSMSGGFRFLRPVWEVAYALGNALVLVFRSGGPVLLWTTCLVLGAMYLTSVGLGTLCYRVAVKKA